MSMFQDKREKMFYQVRTNFDKTSKDSLLGR